MQLDAVYSVIREMLKTLKKLLKSAIACSKRNCFEKLFEEANVDPWGTAYKICMSKFKTTKKRIVYEEYRKKIIPKTPTDFL